MPTNQYREVNLNSQKINSPILGLDIGRSAVKAVARFDGQFYTEMFPSVVSQAINISDEGTRARVAHETVEVEGSVYFTGDAARLQGGAGTTVGLSPDWVNDDAYLALVASAISRFEAKGVQNIDSALVVVGTPSSAYGAQKDLVKARTKLVVTGEVLVLPQPMGAYCDYMFDQRGVPRSELMFDEVRRPTNWAVIEVGHYTTDFLLMLEGQYIERGAASCEGINLAAQDLQRQLAGRGMQANLIECADVIRTRRFTQYGKPVDISAEIDAAIAHVAQMIISKAEALLSADAAALQGILLAGGGAPLIQSLLVKKWPHCTMLEDSRMAVAKGFCRYGMGRALSKTAGRQAA